MSVKLMSAAWDSPVPSTEKMVLLCLCDFANDDGDCWPSVATMVKKTGLSERTVQRALKRLIDSKILTVRERAGTSTNYKIHPRHFDTPVTVTPPSHSHPTPVTVTPHPRHSDTLTTNEPSRTTNDCASGNARQRKSDDGKLQPAHVVEAWNAMASRLGKPTVRELTPQRRQMVKARIAQHQLDDFHAVFGKLEASAFLRGDGNWKKGATFDWLMKQGNFLKVLEGNYD